MARMDHLFLLLGLSQSLFENRADWERAVSGEMRFSLACNVLGSSERNSNVNLVARVHISASEFFIRHEHTPRAVFSRTNDRTPKVRFLGEARIPSRGISVINRPRRLNRSLCNGSIRSCEPAQTFDPPP
jgi:hypothetical protein